MSLVVRGALKESDWGIVDGLVRWAGAATGRPQAELWYGAHPGGPSPLVDPEGVETGAVLDTDLIGGDVPILVKFLAAARPLSIQVHPQAELAADGYKAQISSADSPAVYADRSEKTEMLIALEPFEAFAGWREPTECVSFLRALQSAVDDFDPSAAIAAIVDGDFRSAIPVLLASSSIAAIAALGQSAQFIGLPQAEVDAYLLVSADYPKDPGALLTPLLSFRVLQAGQALFVPAGIPHSYIRGLGIEVMTSSDNVIRLGLTSKPVFLEYALQALDPEIQPQFITAAIGDELNPASAPFRAQLMRDGAEELPSGSYRIVLSVEGKATVSCMGEEITLLPGMANVIPATDPEAVVRAEGLTAVFRALQEGEQ
ncbi:MAG: mannose-6-phosphate isomerase, class I [Actinomycetota bacterium]|nr:mannose-6-phosphate isomerase, class I [Actinomycetota bacterium]